MYDFPNTPTEGERFTASDGRMYEWHVPTWRLMAEEVSVSSDWADITNKPATFPPTVPIPWSSVASPATFPPTLPIAWTNVSGKPTTFPPTLPIAWGDISSKPTAFPPILPINWTEVTGKPAAYPPVLPISWADVSGKPTTFPPTLPIFWADISSKPATFPPTLPIAQADVANLTTDLATKAPLNNPIFTGDPRAPTPSQADNDTSIATTAFVQGQVATLKGTASTSMDTLGEIENYITNSIMLPLANKADKNSPAFTGVPTAPTMPPGDNGSSLATTAFVTNAIGTKLEDAPVDGKYYMRRDGTWVEVPAPQPQPMTYDVNGDAVIKFAGSIMVRIKTTGLILTKDDVEVFSLSV